MADWLLAHMITIMIVMVIVSGIGLVVAAITAIKEGIEEARKK